MLLGYLPGCPRGSGVVSQFSYQDDPVILGLKLYQSLDFARINPKDLARIPILECFMLKTISICCVCWRQLCQLCHMFSWRTCWEGYDDRQDGCQDRFQRAKHQRWNICISMGLSKGFHQVEGGGR